MKVLALIAATTLVVGAAGTAPAQAQTRVVERTTTKVRYDDRGWRHDRHHGSRWGWRTNCRTQWRHGHRERVCRKVRYHRW